MSHLSNITSKLCTVFPVATIYSISHIQFVDMFMSHIKINVLISKYSLVIDITKYVNKFREAILYIILIWNFKT